MLSELLVLACASTSWAATVSQTLEVRDWVVDYQRPTTQPRKAPFDVPIEAKKAAFLANNSYPGVTLEAFEGDTLEVTVINRLLDGQLALDFEGVQVQQQHGLIPQQGGAFTYRLAAPKAGTYWWRARSSLQAARGLKGVLIVRSRNDPSAKLYQEERVMALSEEWVAPEVCLDAKGSLLQGCPEADRATLNGQWGDGSSAYPLPVVQVKKDQCYRLRFVGMMALPSRFEVSIKEHPMKVIGGSQAAASITVPSGKGVDAVVCADKGTLFGGDYSVNMTYVGQTQVRSFFATLRYPIFAKASDPVGYV